MLDDNHRSSGEGDRDILPTIQDGFLYDGPYTTGDRSRSTPRFRFPTIARDLFDAVEEDDPVANDDLDRICAYNAAGLGTLINAYNPDLLTVGGGGVGAANVKTVLERTRPHLEQYTLPAIPEIQPTRLGDEIGLYGALAPYATQHTPIETKLAEVTID